jgi:hypothetical protein
MLRTAVFNAEVPHSRYFIKAEVVNSIPYIKELLEYLQ